MILHAKAGTWALAAAALLSLVFPGQGAAQEKAASPAPTPWPSPSPASIRPDVPEAGSVDSIREATTDPAYLPDTVAYVPASKEVDSPSDFLGHVAGAAGDLTDVATIHAYFRRLAAQSDRVRVQTIGTSNEGREILLAIVSDSENLARLEGLRGITARLADPRRTPEGDLPRLLDHGRVVYHLLGGLHSPETGSPEMLMELAYRLAVSERPEIRAIRESVVVLITPVVEVDGRDRMVQWYRRHLRGRDLPYEELREIASPPYWGHYVFHDNNRDGMQLTQPLTRAIRDTFRAFHPQVLHDLHESLPLLYIMTGHGPYSRAVDPVTINEWTQFAHHEASEMQAAGLPGVWTWGFWDGWWPGYLFSVANNRNAIGRFYETFGNVVPRAMDRDLSETTFVGQPVTRVRWYRPWPPGETVRWSMRDNTNYMEAGVLEALTYASLHGGELLRNFWTKGRRAIQRGRDEAPHAWIFPGEQRDPGRLAHLVNLLRGHDIEVHRLTESFETSGRVYPAGSYTVRMDQPYRNAAVNFLSEQHFPKDEPNPPYDDVAWTWPLLFGVDGAAVDDPAILEVAMEPVSEPVAPPGGLDVPGPVLLLADRGQTSLLRARVMLEQGAGGGAEGVAAGAGRPRVDAAEEPFTAGGRDYPAGSWILQAPRELAARVAEACGLVFHGAARAPDVPRHEVDLPRIGVLHTWTSTQDCGWVRYTLDRDGVTYTLLSPDDLRAGNLGARADVILFPNTSGNLARIVHGIDPEHGPLAYTKTDDFPSHGIPDGSEDITGGMGFEGLSHLQEFVEGGGVLLAIANAGTLAVDGGLVRDVKRAGDAPRTPGSVLRTKVIRRDHPIAYGYETDTYVFRGNGPLWDVAKRHRDLAVMQFGWKDPETLRREREAKMGIRPAAPGGERLLLSGYVESEEKIHGKPAILDVPVGKGRVILYAFNPMHRFLNLHDFRLATNAILHWNDLPR